ncbi:MAG: LacI family DNA-binding transcriptional regulator [Deltaproteobacteria bacterium]
MPDKTTDPRVTLRDIAQAADVSVSTASRALSGAAGISDKVRARIQSVAESLNYAGGAQPLNVTIISNLNVMETGAGEFVQGLMRGIEIGARELGVTLTLNLIGHNGPQLRAPDASVAGYLLLSLQDDEIVSELARHGLPIVIVNGRESQMHVDAIAPANKTGGYLATRHLIDLGHRRILTLAYSARPTIRDRLEGHQKAMHEAGLEDDKDLIIELAAMRTDVTYQVIAERLKRPGGLDFTAIQCCNDASAFGAMTAVREAGLRIPEDISIVGFDDIPTASMASPPLTTIRVDCAHIGTTAVRRLVERLRDPSLPASHTEFAVSLIDRASTGLKA